MLSYNPLAINANSSQFQPVGYDFGNGFAKCCFQGQVVAMPSLIKQLTDSYEYEISGNGALVEYHDGDRSDLAGTRWLLGDAARTEFPDSLTHIVDDRQNKVTYSLQGLLGTLSQFPNIPKVLNLAICSSVHDAESFTTEVKSALNGCHLVRVNGLSIQVNIKSLIVDEGCGVVYHAIKSGLALKTEKIALIDIGSGTAIGSVFNGASLIKASRYVHPQGANKLIQSVCDHPLTRGKLGGVSGDRTLVLAGLKDASFTYGKQAGFNFYEQYTALLANWVQDCLAPTFKKLSPWLSDCDRVIACGGGVLLPGVSRLLAKKNIEVLSNPQQANCLGLALVSQSKLGA